jgi:DNA-binding MarR family transcriptional regulator/GNAT superfamily N-acetyltransferase
MGMPIIIGRPAPRYRPVSAFRGGELCWTAGLSLTKIRQMDRSAIARVRSFNRTVAELIGAMDDRFLGRPRPMGESRTLWEIEPQGSDVRDLRAHLGFDSGYMSRVLRALEREGLVQVGTSPDDRRVRRARLTDAGLAERSVLEARSDDLASGLLEPLAEEERAQLVAAMSTVDRLLRASVVKFAVEPPDSRAARWCIARYFAELDTRFRAGFDPRLSISADAAELTPPRGALLIARMRSRPVGCGALKFHGDAPAELKRMWVAPEARGLGLGRRLLNELETYAQSHGATAVRLETNDSLREAIALYRASGYREVAAFNAEPYADHWFEKRLGAPGASD